MCTSIVEIAAAEGMAKRADEWFPLTHAVVAYDHARHALLGDVITLDFVNEALPPGARAAVELTLETAKALNAALAKAIAAAEIEEADRSEGLERARLDAPAPAAASLVAAASASAHRTRRQGGDGFTSWLPSNGQRAAARP